MSPHKRCYSRQSSRRPLASRKKKVGSSDASQRIQIQAVMVLSHVPFQRLSSFAACRRRVIALLTLFCSLTSKICCLCLFRKPLARQLRPAHCTASLNAHPLRSQPQLSRHPARYEERKKGKRQIKAAQTLSAQTYRPTQRRVARPTNNKRKTGGNNSCVQIYGVSKRQRLKTVRKQEKRVRHEGRKENDCAQESQSPQQERKRLNKRKMVCTWYIHAGD